MAIPVVVVLAVLLFLLGRHGRGDDAAAGPSASRSSLAPSAFPPVDVSPVPGSAAADRLCPDLLAAMPRTVDGAQRRRVNAQHAYFLAWGVPPIIAQCGLPRPAGFALGSQTIDINPTPKDPKATVRWFQSGDTGRWTAVDREVYVTVTVPEGGDTQSDLQAVGAAITRVLPARPIHPAR